MLVKCMNLKKIGMALTSKSVGTGPSSYDKKNLPGRDLTTIEKHCTRQPPSCFTFRKHRKEIHIAAAKHTTVKKNLRSIHRPSIKYL